MKRLASLEEPMTSSSEESSDFDSENDTVVSTKHADKSGCSKTVKLEANVKRKKLGSVNYEALSKHGYHGGPSILKLPPPKPKDNEQDWSWSTGKEGGRSKDSMEESFKEREETRAAARGEELQKMQANLQMEKREKKSSFSQKEKRKRDLGQASRGKNYVEEEKRLLRDSGIYSGFDS
ncbi:hypothetical protein HPP92_019927 [Vanilla planifolia]|uniref:Uncharacterized protein n=1 Tax=Vanilla planifolia TaxID=51239 RepID=A0A835Q148_VANPL|nr:hypothetical protein HPP92_020354 [Vanilla planifolia]KAG0465763.1 hypothetical protein HPP92_019927 [Vanilla planifolia]